MIDVSFYKNDDGVYNGVKVLGHAGYADSGQDVVCAAVSALVINALNSIEAFTSDKFETEFDEKSGRIELHIQENVSNESKLLLESLYLGLSNIAESYESEYIKINL